MQQDSLASAVTTYQRKRSLAWEFAQELFALPGLQLGAIQYRDAALADNWASQWSDPSRRPAWQWAEMHARYNQKAAFKRFEVAVSVNGRLCALSYGMPTSGKLILKIHAVARAPVDNPLVGQVLPIVLACADSYARLLGSREVWICNPVNEGVAKYYESFEFSPVTDRNGVISHLIMRIQE